MQKKGILQLWPHNRTGFKVVHLKIHFIMINMIDSKQSARLIQHLLWIKTHALKQQRISDRRRLRAGPPKYRNSRSGGRRQGTGKIIHCDSIHSNGCTVYEATDRIYFPQRKRFPDKGPDIDEQFILQTSRRRAVLLKETISQNEIYYYENGFLISREGLDISSSRTTLRD